jgi:hypothetical protein
MLRQIRPLGPGEIAVLLAKNHCQREVHPAARGEEIDVERHALLCSTLTRLAQRIGIDRRARTITPTVRDYLEHIEAAE